MMRRVAYGLCALLTAASGDALVEALQNRGLFGAAEIDGNHQGVVAVLALAAFALCGFGAAVVRRRFAGGDGDWLIALARDVGRATPRTHLVAIVGGALAIVCAIEEYERGFGGDAPFAGAGAAPLLSIVSLAIYVGCAAVVARALGAFMRGLVATCDALARVARAVFAWRDRALGSATSFRGYAARAIVARRPVRAFAASGDRSPPRILTLDAIS